MTESARNVLLGFMGFEVPEMPRQRNKTRAGYRKTDVKRPRGSHQRKAAPVRQDSQLALEIEDRDPLKI